ncbi:MAG: ATP-binding protein [Desulfurococcales archaeon]|nr:ATP-binding protein [Desulfurococcales archaeon]
MSNIELKPIGVIVGESSPLQSIVLFDPDHNVKPRVGMYVTTETEEGAILGIVESIRAGNPLLPSDMADVNDAWKMSRFRDLPGKKYLRGLVQWLSLLEPLERGEVRSPGLPPIPSSDIYPASRTSLSTIFGPEGKKWIRIGRLLSDETVPFKINIDQLARHLAVLAVTGGGKSNTVCILTKRIVEELGGTVVIFDMHGEYSSMDVPGIINVRDPQVNPVNLTFEELKTLARLPDNAHNQERVLREAWEKVSERRLKDKVQARDIMNLLKEIVRAMIEEKNDSTTKGAARGVLNRLDDITYYYGDIIDGFAPLELEEFIAPGKLNVVDLSSVDEKAADAVVAHYLRRLLAARKEYIRKNGQSGYPVPVIAFIEEAHILVSSSNYTLTRYWASRIAREGRKFQLGIALVSQRPKNVDPEVLSQTNNKIILRIVEPTDMSYVQRATEQMSDNIKELLPGLNPGEAVVVGMMARLPAIVKIDLCDVKKSGSDVSLSDLWMMHNRAKNTPRDVSDVM